MAPIETSIAYGLVLVLPGVSAVSALYSLNSRRRLVALQEIEADITFKLRSRPSARRCALPTR